LENPAISSCSFCIWLIVRVLLIGLFLYLFSFKTSNIVIIKKKYYLLVN